MMAQLRPQEKRLWAYLIKHIDKIVTHEDIRLLLGGETYAHGRVNVFRIRKILRTQPTNGLRIHSVHGHGYRLTRSNSHA